MYGTREFSDTIFGWIGPTSDYFILHTTPNHQLLRLRNHGEMLGIVQGSNDERVDILPNHHNQEYKDCG